MLANTLGSTLLLGRYSDDFQPCFLSISTSEIILLLIVGSSDLVLHSGGRSQLTSSRPMCSDDDDDDDEGYSNELSDSMVDDVFVRLAPMSHIKL